MAIYMIVVDFDAFQGIFMHLQNFIPVRVQQPHSPLHSS